MFKSKLLLLAILTFSFMSFQADSVEAQQGGTWGPPSPIGGGVIVYPFIIPNGTPGLCVDSNSDGIIDL